MAPSTMVKYNDMLLMISCLLLNAHAIQTDTCQQRETSVSISTQRNNTGHWNSEIKMDFEPDAARTETTPRNLGVSFYSKRCNGKESFSIVTDISVRAPRGPGYELFAGVGYYKFHTTKLSWSDAERTCVDEGGHLVIFNSDAEADIAKQLFSRNKQLAAWAFIGFHDKNTEGVYVTIFDVPLQATGYTKWRNGQPDNAGDEDCGSIDHDAKLNDLPCGLKSPFICEYEL